MKKHKLFISILVALMMVVSPLGSVCYANNNDNEALTDVITTEATNEETLPSSEDSLNVEQKSDEDIMPEAVESSEELEIIDETTESNVSEENGERLLANGSPEESEETFVGGDGTQGNPYQIETVSQLNMIRDNLSACYILTSDLAFDESDFLEGGQFYNDGSGWLPIGSSDSAFTGSLNGNGHSINGLFISSEDAYSGLFGYTSGAKISNLSISGNITVSVVSTDANVGSLIGYSTGGSVSNIESDCAITASKKSTTSNAKQYVGGVIGYNNTTPVSGCENHGAVESTSSYSCAGGIAGYSEGTVTNCSNSGNVNAKYYSGGIVGWSKGSISNCSNSGQIEVVGVTKTDSGSPNIAAGGIVGAGSCSKCSNTGTVMSTAYSRDSYAGGIAGTGSNISECINSGYVESKHPNAGQGTIIAGGIAASGSATKCINNGEVTGSGSPSSIEGARVGGIVAYNGGSGTVSFCCNNGYIHVAASQYDYVGGIVGGYGTGVQNSYNTGPVTATKGRAGGISGYNQSGISDCYNTGVINGARATGGISGENSSKVTNVYNIGNVKGSQTGGIMGTNSSATTTGCYYLNRISRGAYNDEYIGVSCSIEEMCDQSTFAEFDFSSTWAIDNSHEYQLPTLLGVLDVEAQYDLSLGDSIIGFEVTGVNSEYEYTGNEIRPSVSVSGLTIDRDYRVEYINNTNVGTATVKISGYGDYSGVITKTFRITPKNISQFQLSGFDEEYCYTGDPIEPSAALGNLVLDSDYTLSYENNVDGGTATITATGTGNYTGTVSGEFTIYVPVDISEMSFSGLERTYSYTGEEIVPQISVGNLVKDVDYTLSIENNTSVGTATIKATGKKYYTGELVSSFEIEPADISGFEIGNLKESYVQTGSEIVPNITIDGLVKGEDYTVACTNNVAIGKATITITGIGNYTGGIVKHYSIVDEDISNKKAYISSDTIAYTGEEIKPAVTIVGLVQDEDFTVSYSNNVEVGTADIYVQGANTFTGEMHIPFTITKGSISDLDVKTDKDAYAFTGESIIPTITVLSAKGSPLVENDDYTVKLYSNTNVGSALFVITGTGNYKGFLVGTFEIVPLSIANGSVSGIANKTYSGKAITQSITVKVDGKTLKQGSDYTISYKNNTNVGTATLTIAGSGNYNGTITKTFKINKAANPLTVKVKTATLKYSNVKKKTQNLAVSKVLTVTKNQGKVTYVKASGNSKITINKTTGKVTVKKGLKKGTYSVKVKVIAAGNSNYNKVTKTVTFKVKIK